MIEAPCRIDVFDTIGSTNAEALARLAAGDVGPAVVAARVQTAGRGRRGRAWASPEGGLYFTYYAATAEHPQRLALLGFVAALAVADLVERGGANRVQVKWPNDVLVQGAKIAGILLEASALADGRQGFALGIGVNLGAAPAGLDRTTASLNGAVEADEAAALLMERLSLWGRRLQGEGFETVRQAWLARAFGLGETVHAAQGEGRIAGRFVDLDADGALVLDKGGDRVRITAGEVFFDAEG